jgi:hypothetical protein
VRWCVALLGALALVPDGAAAIEPHRFCGTYETARGEEARVWARGTTCAEAIRVARGFHVDLVRIPPWFCGLNHGPGAQRVPFSCGWGGRRGDLRKWPHSIVVRMDPPQFWPDWPILRPVASPAAQAFMPLVFLDDDDHWSITDPDWFLAKVDVQHCRQPAGGCARLDKRTMRDGTRRYMRFGREDGRDGPDGMFVNQVEPGQPAYPGGAAMPSSYRFFDYWWFYPFNRGPYGWSEPIAGNFDHLSDWEGATVATRPGRDDVFDFVALSAHEAAWNYLPGVLRCGEGLDGDARHETGCAGRRRVNVYPAEGTHANYPRRCGRSMLELNPLERGICAQTGLTNVHGAAVNLPEGRFNGKDDRHADMLGEQLSTLQPVADWDWTNYDGFWDDTENVRTPTRQDRFKDPLSGSRACTPRWSGDNEQRPCGPEFETPGAARLAAIAAQSQAAVDPCEAWFGPMVLASACRPAELAAALRDGRVSDDGGIRLAGRHELVASGAGVAQSLGAPAPPGAPVAITGPPGPADVRVRLQAPGAVLDVRFDGVPLSPTAPMSVAIDRAGRVLATAPDGRPLAPSARRRSARRRPPPARRVRARRAGGRVVVRFARVRGRVDAALLARRLGRPIDGRIVRGRSGRAVVDLPRRPVRYVAARRIGRDQIPSRARVVRIRR